MMTTLLSSETSQAIVLGQSLEVAKSYLSDFASSPDFQAKMQLAFGNTKNWKPTDLIDFPPIEIRPASEINNARGAFATATNTIYLSQELVDENSGNIGAIASVLVEEYGHYLDAQMNAIDSPGDEGEIFANLVLGKGLSESELLGLWGEDDGAIVFWDGEWVSIEQAEKTQTDNLDFFAGEIQDWGGLPSEDLRFTLFDEKIPEQPIEQNVNNSFISYDFGVQANLKGELFATPGSFGKARFSYPVQIDTQLPTQVGSGEAFAIVPGVNASVNSGSFSNIGQGTEGFEIPNAGVNFSLDLGSAKFQNIEIKNPFGDPIRLDGIDVGSTVGKAELNLDIASFLAGQVSGDLLGGKISAKLPKINALEPTNPSGNAEQLPSIAATGKTDNVLNLAFDLDQIILSRFPAYLALQKSLQLAGTGIELNGLGFALDFPNAAEEQARAVEARDRANQAKEDLNIQLDVLRTIPSEGQTLALQEAERLSQTAEQTRLEAEALEQGSQQVENFLKQQRNKIQLSGDILDIQANVGIAFQQEYSFIPEDVEVTFSVEEGSVDGGQESTKTLGETFDITAPSEGTGVMEVKADYELSGDVKNNIGLILQGSLDGKVLELAGNITLGGAKVFQEQFGPLINVKIPSGGLASPPFTIIGSDPDPIPLLPSDPTLDFRQIETINTDEIGGQEDETKNLEIEKTYYIPYGMPVSISDASAEEGETLQFTVTLAETSDEPVSIDYSSEKGSGTVSFAPGETTQIIEIPTPDDQVKEETETFEITLNNPNGVSFPENLPNGESTITATGTIFDNDEKPDPDPPEPNPQTYNDPRIITIDGQYHDFQAAGEFTLLESKNGDFKIQVRQQPVGNNPLSNVSDNTAVATILGGQRVALYNENQQLLIDGVPTTILDNEYIFVGDGRIYREGNTYSLIYPEGDQLIAKMTRNRINISLFLSPGREGQVQGLLGTFNNNPNDDLIKADGTVLTSPISPEKLYGDYTDSWRISQGESLFDYAPGQDTNTFTLKDYPRETVRLSDLDPADVQRAEELIGDRITDPIIRETVIIDLVLTDFDPEIIEAAINVPSPQGSVIIRVEPEAKEDVISTFANTPVQIDPLSNDIATTGIPLSLTGYDQTTATGGTIELDNNGTPDDKTDDQLIYTPATNFIGIDTINYTIADDQTTATGTISVIVPALNLTDISNNGLTIAGAAGNFVGSSVSTIGDFNGDGIDDISIGAFAADPNGNNAAGESYIIFGTNQGFPTNLDLSTLNGTNGFIIEGFEAESFSGAAVSSAGDINGDGLQDLIIGAFASDSNSLSDSGQTYVVFGSNQPLPNRFNLANLDGTNGFKIDSDQALDYAGISVSSAGDFNNDGWDDLAVAAPAGINTFLGKVYIVNGRNTGFPDTVYSSHLKPENGTVINHESGLSGTTISNAGDINGDSIDDLIIGTEQGVIENNPQGGEAYVLFGKTGGYPAGFSLSNVNGSNGFNIKGGGFSVSSVSGAGDINADGLGDIIIGVSESPVNNQINAGKAYVVFGTQAGFPEKLDLLSLNGNNGFVINGVEADELLGGSVQGAGDVNGDQIDDLIIGASGATANGVIGAGKTYVVFGSNQGFAASLNSSELNGENGFFINGTTENELSGVAVGSAGDINQDGINDMLIGAPGSLFDNAEDKTYVVFGSSAFGNQPMI